MQVGVSIPGKLLERIRLAKGGESLSHYLLGLIEVGFGLDKVSDNKPELEEWPKDTQKVFDESKPEPANMVKPVVEALRSVGGLRLGAEFEPSRAQPKKGWK